MVISVYIALLSCVLTIVFFFRNNLEIIFTTGKFPLITNLKFNLNEFIHAFNQDNTPHQVFLRYFIALVSLFIIICFISINVLFILLILRRLIKFDKEKKDALKIEHIQKLIIQYLYSDKSAYAIDQLRRQQKQIVVDQLLALYVSIVGNKARMVRELFFSLKLDEYVYMRCNNYYWHVRVKYMDIASIMKIERVKNIAQRYMHSSNSLMRTCAIKAYLNLDSEHSFDYLHRFKKYITEWNQINLYNLIVKQSLSVPSFYQFLSSDNPTVVCFALKMIQLHIQTERRREVLQLLLHKDTAVRKEVVITIKVLYIKEAVPLLMANYKTESELVQFEIIRTLAKLDTEESTLFLINLLNVDDFKFRMEIIKNISLTYRKRILTEFESNKEIVAIVKHVSDKRIMF
ncbi:MAG: HEAT repeat domain-containing protein [Paludibacteraceae bacterium]|nr:HEAT repeat domain-containing protein [Paludibacteraceae bacterium]